MSIVEWRVALEGHAAKSRARRWEQAWTVSHLLIAAGCDAEKVSPAKLLGEEKELTIRQKIAADQREARKRAKVIERIRKDRESRGIVEKEAV